MKFNFVFAVLLSFLTLFLNLSILNAQIVEEKWTCHSTEFEAKLRSKYPALGTRSDFENTIQKVINTRKSERSTNQEFDTIPVIVHVIHNGDAVGVNENISQAQINSQITALNNDYGKISGTLGDNSLSFSSDSKIRFALALYDPNGELLTEPGIDRVLYASQASWTDTQIDATLKPNTQWDPKRYLNIWTVTFGGSSKSVLGYAQFPERANSGLSDLQSSEVANTDGVVISYRAFGTTGNISTTYNKGRTASHEIGHFLGLYHIWGDQQDCSGTDYCGDTPPCSAENYNCPTTAPIQCSNQTRLISNYMDYSPDGCMNNFTNNQTARMQAVLNSSPRRLDLLSSTVHIPTFSPFAKFTESSSLICEGDQITLTDISTNNPTNRVFSIYPTGNATPTVTTTSSPFNFTCTQSGVYDISLTSTNAYGQNTKYKSQYLGVVSKQTLSIPFYENFQSNSYLPNWISYNLDTITNWKRTTPIITVDGISKTLIGSNGSATYAYFANNYEDDFSYTRDAIISPSINMSNFTSLTLNFDVAYATIRTGGILYTDSLQILITTNCGASFTKIWQKGGTQLTSTTFNTAGFVPTTKTVWRNETITLSNFINTGNFNLAIVNLSGYANNLFLDNISISGITIQTVPASNFYASPKVVCQGSSVQFSDSSTNKPTGWNWNISGATTTSFTSQNPVATYTSTGIYDVQLTASNIAGTGNTKTKAGYIQVVPLPTISITGTTLLSSLSNGNQWYKDNQLIQWATTTSFSIPSSASGTYYVVNTLAGSTCKSNSQTISLTDLKNQLNDGILDVKLFPIPATNELQIETSNGEINLSDLEIFDLLGRKYEIKSIQNNDSNLVSFDINHLSPGTYLAKINLNGKTVFKRWVKI